MPTVSVKKLNDDGTPSGENIIEIQAQEGDNLWESLDEEGHKLPHGCLNGSCSACRVQVLKGSEHLALPGPQEVETLTRFLETYREKLGDEAIKGKTIRLSCQAKISDKEGEIEISPFN